MDIQGIENGQAAIAEAIRTVEGEQRAITLPTATLRRVARLHARLEGANAAAQAAIAAAQQAQAALQAALNEACEEEGFKVPADGNTPVDVDWRTGRLSFR